MMKRYSYAANVRIRQVSACAGSVSRVGVRRVPRACTGSDGVRASSHLSATNPAAAVARGTHAYQADDPEPARHCVQHPHVGDGVPAAPSRRPRPRRAQRAEAFVAPIEDVVPTIEDKRKRKREAKAVIDEDVDGERKEKKKKKKRAAQSG